MLAPCPRVGREGRGAAHCHAVLLPGLAGLGPELSSWGGHWDRPCLSHCVLPTVSGLHLRQGQESEAGGPGAGAVIVILVLLLLAEALLEGSRFWGPEVNAFCSG